MTSENNITIIRLCDLLAIEKETDFQSTANNFRSKDPDVEQFLKNKAIQSTKLKTSSTYLIIDISNTKKDLLGYFTLATKVLSFQRGIFSKNELKIIKRFASNNSESDIYTIPAILIAQLSKNFSEDSKSIKGNDLLAIIINKILDILNSTSGKIIFLECNKQNKKVLNFYLNHNFKPLNEVYSKSRDKLIQLYYIV